MLSHSPKLWLTRLLKSMEFEKWYVHQFASLRGYITLSEKEFWSFYHFLPYPHCQIMTSFMGYLGTSNVANSKRHSKIELNFLIVHSFTFYLLYKHQFSVTNLTYYSCAGFAVTSFKQKIHRYVEWRTRITLIQIDKQWVCREAFESKSLRYFWTALIPPKMTILKTVTPYYMFVSSTLELIMFPLLNIFAGLTLT